MMSTGFRFIIGLSSVLSGCATGDFREGNFSPEYIIDSGKGRMSNTRAVYDCERSRSYAECYELRSAEINRALEYIQDAYEENPARTLAEAMLVSEGFDILIARQGGAPYEPAGGRPFTPIGNVPPLRSERLAREAAQSQAASDLLDAVGAVASGVAGAASIPSGGSSSSTVGGGSGGDQGAVYQGTGRRTGPANCAPDIVDAGAGRSRQDC